jgi:CRISPR/Cas system-associated endoribonuclease Cas2
MPKLHWMQNSVFAGELNQVAAKDLLRQLTEYVRDSKVTFWLFDRKPETFLIGKQDDGESIFM